MTERVDQMLAVLPRGHSLDEAAWAPRHRMLLVLLAAHIPGLLIVGAVGDDIVTFNALSLAPIVAAIAVGLVATSRVVRAGAVTLGLVYSTTVLVLATGGLIQAHFHSFVMLSFVALYRDWRPYLVAVTYVVVGHGVAGVLFPGVLYDHPAATAQPVLWAVVHGGFILAACAAHVTFWKQTERQQRVAEAYYAQLYEGERAVVAQLRQAQRVKDELIAVVGHEFRTPLTAIQGFARTLDARFDRMDHDAVQACTGAIERESKRLTRLVANLLSASEEVKVAESPACRLFDVVREVVEEVTQTLPMAGRRVWTHVSRGHALRMSPDHAHQLLFNLVDNAVKFSAPDSEVRVSSRVDGDMIVVEVANAGTPVSERDRERIFDAFVQGDSSDTRRHGGLGLGLHIACKIVTAYGGRIEPYSDGPIVIFRMWLPRSAAIGRPTPGGSVAATPPVYAPASSDTLLEA